MSTRENIRLIARAPYLDEEERAGCFILFVFLMSCFSYCSVALPHSAVGWSVLCDCDIF